MEISRRVNTATSVKVLKRNSRPGRPLPTPVQIRHVLGKRAHFAKRGQFSVRQNARKEESKRNRDPYRRGRGSSWMEGKMKRGPWLNWSASQLSCATGGRWGTFLPAQPLPLVDFSTRVKTRPDLPTRAYIFAIMLDGLFCSRASPFETGLCTFGRWVGFRFVTLIMAMIEYFLTIFRKFDDQILSRFKRNAVT